MEQQRLDWSRDVSLPVSGRSVEARHASASGANAERERRGRFALVYRELLMKAGPLSDHAVAKITGRSLSAVNSTRAAFDDRVVPSGEYETKTWADGRITKRVLWVWRDYQAETQAWRTHD